MEIVKDTKAAFARNSFKFDKNTERPDQEFANHEKHRQNANRFISVPEDAFQACKKARKPPPWHRFRFARDWISFRLRKGPDRQPALAPTGRKFDVR